MSKATWNIVSIVTAVVFAAIALVSAFMGGCSSTVELASGSTMPMKCFWTFVADTYVSVAGIALALVGTACTEKTGRRLAGAGAIVCAAAAACLPAPFAIGLCANPEMHCHTTALIVWVLCAVAAILGIVQIAKAGPAPTDLPARRL